MNRNSRENAVFVLLINFLTPQKPLDTLDCVLSCAPPQGPHYLAYFHSRQQKEETCKVLSCLIHWVQMSM